MSNKPSITPKTPIDTGEQLLNQPVVKPPDTNRNVVHHTRRHESKQPQARQAQTGNPARPINKPSQSQRVPVFNPVPPLNFPEALPVSGRRDEIARAINQNQVVIVCGETGSGKTTQLPKICLFIGRGVTGLIGHTQPRRLAASATAKRIAEELGTPLGENVGYKVRFTDTLSKGAAIKLMTDGILLAETQHDPLLRAYDTIIIDEAHERSLNIDFLLGYLKELLPRRPDLKLIITSATIDSQRFAQHFAQHGKPAPVFEVSGRLYPVEMRYRPFDEDKDEDDKALDVYDAIADAVDELSGAGRGDILVFLPGEREIRDAAEKLRGSVRPGTEILPLFARLTAQEQERVFHPSGVGQRIVLATNVAETSLTVPGIRYVIDTGLARVKRYSYRNKVEQLQVEPVSQAAANQRAGRCGRVADGICIRLYSEPDFKGRAPFTDPEILRSSLAHVILSMQSLHLTDVETFPFIEAPSPRAITDGYQLLQELGAMDEARQLTHLGRQLAKLPLDPRVGRMLLAAKEQHCIHEMLVIASALSVQDPRERPLDKQEAADTAHKKFADDKSEFVSWLKIWTWHEGLLNDKSDKELTNRQLQTELRKHFISSSRMREWRDVYKQLLSLAQDQQWSLNDRPASYEQLHCALLTGLLGNLGFKTEEGGQYLGARGIKFQIFPGSALAKKGGRWIMAAELTETTRLYARCIAQIQPEWVEKVARHLLKTSLADPHWEKKAQQVIALERATLYGLPIYLNRRIHYATRNLAHARELFIREGLVTGEFESRLAFYAHNQKLMAEIEQLEHKTRRPDVLVDEALIFAFYDAHLPADIVHTHGLEHWYAQASKHQPDLLKLSRDDLMRHEAAGVTSDQFPKSMEHAGVLMSLAYHFEPGNVRDGVTLTVPLYALNQVSVTRCEWLVPGMLKEKVQLLLKSLPQKLRRHLVPLPDYAQGFCERSMQSKALQDMSLIDALIADVRAQTTLMLNSADFKLETLSAHHMMNFLLIDEHGRQLGMGRSLAALKAEHGREAQGAFAQKFSAALAGQGKAGLQTRTSTSSTNKTASGAAPTSGKSSAQPQSVLQSTELTQALESEHIASWTFGVLPELLEIRRGGLTLMGYPALKDALTHCTLEVYDDPDEARLVHRAGLRRLFALNLKEQLKVLEKNIPNLTNMALQYRDLGSQDELRDQLVAVTLNESCLKEPLPLNAEDFAQRIIEARSRLGLLIAEVSRLTASILTEYAALQRKLPQVKANRPVFDDITNQLQALLPKDFVLVTPYAQLSHFPRYLKAAVMRVDKFKADPVRDQQRQAEMQPLLQQWQRQVSAQRKGGGQVDPRLIELRWLLEELRVNLFAQELRTPMPVSVKRLQKVWESLQR